MLGKVYQNDNYWYSNYLLSYFSVLFPFFNNPYRINIFSFLGGCLQDVSGPNAVPRLFPSHGLRLWVIPALFFKIFGPYFFTLIKLRSLSPGFRPGFQIYSKYLNVRPVVILLSVLVYCFSYVSFNFWPWYNNMVFAFELVAIYFTLLAIFSPGGWKCGQVWGSQVFLSSSLFYKTRCRGSWPAHHLRHVNLQCLVDKSVKSGSHFQFLFDLCPCLPCAYMAI